MKTVKRLLFGLSIVLFTSALFKPITSFGYMAPEKKIDLHYCEVNGEIVSVGNYCMTGDGFCQANPCTGP